MIQGDLDHLAMLVPSPLNEYVVDTHFVVKLRLLGYRLNTEKKDLKLQELSKQQQNNCWKRNFLKIHNVLASRCLRNF